ncbi:MAG: DMT family transporter [Leuconostoc gelidum]|jgi:drug/metabolite transporter (DMT)-like permease|uniref:DMT family transporter n=1 Tax=Leuconostoc gasicomitatum TaxID=115778 RepID=A0A9Q3SXY8_9LACO|nr:MULTISPECIES: DMT family transporter [Leuconostoc gelidum group]MBZ5962412.1 DMT family transporter [Leuconostoc gasicomitatum]MBZ5978768.1 DMT family transporter [Leuconostoc gelidum subsp. gelidum]MBZ5996804.1 DMT family transporter [Leuconostoc gasicomitatum]MBZ6001778.1 DMT family transporter [Leuconostoc gelidum subsp. gelidum]QDJ29238.1 transporter [Leuconostoc gelidum subsp. gelidum]
MNRTMKGILACTIAGIAFGAQWPVAGSALKVIDPYYFTLIRYFIVAVVLSIILLATEGVDGFKIKKKQVLHIAIMGTLAFCVYNFLVFAGQQMAGTSGTILASLLMALIPMVSVLVVWLIYKKRPSGLTLLFVVTSLFGVILVITKGSLKVIVQDTRLIFPISLMVISVLAWVLYTIGGSRFKEWSSIKYTTLSCLFGNVVSIVVILIMTKVDFVKVPTVSTLIDIKWQIVYMSLIAGVVGVLMWNVGNKILTPQNGSLFMNLVPVVTFVIEVMQGYNLSVIELLGAIITIVSIILNNVLQRRKQGIISDTIGNELLDRS